VVRQPGDKKRKQSLNPVEMEKRRASNRKAAKRSRLRKKIFIEWLQQRAQLLEKDRQLIETTLKETGGEHERCLELIKGDLAKLDGDPDAVGDDEGDSSQEPKEKAKRKRWSDPLEKLERYRERNREHAKKSRQQKKVFIEDLVKKVNDLHKRSEIIRATVEKELGETKAKELLSKVTDPALLQHSAEELSITSNIDTMGLLGEAEKKMEEEGLAAMKPDIAPMYPRTLTPSHNASRNAPQVPVAAPAPGVAAVGMGSCVAVSPPLVPVRPVVSMNNASGIDSLYCLALASCREQETDSPSRANGSSGDEGRKENDNGSSDDGASRQEAEAEAREEAVAAQNALAQQGSAMQR
jgi:hypothetical protein